MHTYLTKTVGAMTIVYYKPHGWATATLPTTLSDTSMTAQVHSMADHKAYTCDCGSVNFALLMSEGIECNGCGKRQPFEWREYDAHECPDCGGAGRVTRYSKVTHQLGSDDLPFLEECETCSGLGWCGPDAEKRAALAKAAT